MNLGLLRTRWAAVGAAVAVTLGAGGLGITHATSPAGAVAFVPITPCRIVDTRPAPDTVGSRTSPLGPAETFTVSAHGDNGNCTGIPNTATGLSLNVTAIGATSGSFLTIWATGAPQPTSSSLNPQPGAPPIPNAVTTGVSAGGQFNIFNAAGSVNVLVDVVGYYTDHNHDDRYYTEAEVDAAIAAAKPVFATVAADGTLISARSRGATSVTKDAGSGTYRVFFEDSNIAGCAFIATPSDLSQAPETVQVGIQGAPLGTTGVFVQTANNSNTLVDSGFFLVVVC